MKKYYIFLVFFTLILFAFGSASAHDHIDSGEGYVVYAGYVAPTADSDGTTGPGTCSVCGAEVEPAVRIPKLQEQREVNNPPDPTAPPTEAPTPVPTAAPTPVPAADPAPVPAAAPTAAPAAETAKPPAPGPTAVPASVTAPPSGQAETPVPPRVTAPPASSNATPVPAAVQPSSGSVSLPKPQSDRDSFSSGSVPVSEPNSYLGSESGSRSGGNKSSAAPAAVSGSTRNLNLYPVFSSRFPWRRLRMNPEANIELHLAGRLLWPLPEASSPLMVILQP